MLPSSLARAADIAAVAVNFADIVAAGDDCAAVYYSLSCVVYLNSNSNRRTR